MKLFIAIFMISFSLYGADTTDQIRSKILETAIKIYFSHQGYGEVKEVNVDSTKKQLSLHLYPEGEREKLTITIGKYEQKVVDNKEVLVLQNIQTNRTWLTRIFADHMKEGIKVPLRGTMGALPLLLGL